MDSENEAWSFPFLDKYVIQSLLKTMQIPLGSFLILGWYDHLAMFFAGEVRLYFWDISFRNISHALQFRASLLFAIVLLIPESPMHTVPLFADELFTMLAKIKAFPKLDYFQDKPWSNRANYFLCFHWEASQLRAISPAHLLKIQAPEGIGVSAAVSPLSLAHRGPTCAAGRGTNSFISEQVFELVWIKDTMKAFLFLHNFHFKCRAGAGGKNISLKNYESQNTVRKQNIDNNNCNNNNVFETK